MHIAIVEARFYTEISDFLKQGVVQYLEEHDLSYESVEVPGAMEVPAAIHFLSRRKNGAAIDGYVALGCVIRGQTSHYDLVCNESARGLTDLALRRDLAIANGILTCENRAQALERADPGKRNKGYSFAKTVHVLVDIRRQCGLI